MIRRVVRAAGMGRQELAWRGRAALWTAADRARAALVPSRWDRGHFARLLADADELARIRQAAAAGRWMDAQAELSQHLWNASQRFVIAPRLGHQVATRVRAEFPSAPGEAAARADRIVAGDYDLLGYRGLRFDHETAAANRRALLQSGPDWHYDPVHRRRAPMAFWTRVSYLSPACGDHKIIWELNRHQHWLALGRAFWLTGERRYRDHAIDELASWLRANPPLVGINWASMLELAFRSLSWVWAMNFFVDQEASDRSPWLVDLLVAIDRQLRHISRNLSYYFSPNTHLLGEALALYVGGKALPFLAASAQYTSIGRRLLLEEADRQILPDGGHCERSTHYHRYALDFYLLALAVARITGDAAADDLERAASRLAFAARVLANDRGTLPHIGDDDGGTTWPLTGRPVDDVGDSLAIAAVLTREPDLRLGPAPEEAFWMLAHPPLAAALDGSRAWPLAGSPGSGALPDTGYYVSRSAAGDHLVVDAGQHGYRNAGHAHADALSIAFCLRGLPLLIDPGTGCYTVEASLRDRLRSTPLHNTLTLDGVPQSTPAGPFHWLRTADAELRRWRTNVGFDYLEAAHRAYAPVEHRRHVLFVQSDLLVVADLVTGDCGRPHRSDVHWHLDPRWKVAVDGRRATFSSMGEQAELVVAQGALELLNGDADGLGWHAPVYGRVEPAATLRVTHAGDAPYWLVSVFGLAGTNPVCHVDTFPVWAEAGVLAHACAVRVSRASSTDYVLFADPASGTLTRGSTWRLAEYETDARLLFCRTDQAGALARAAMVEGTRLRASGRAALALSLPDRVPDLHIAVRGAGARLSGRTAGARLQIAGRDAIVEPDRRSAPRDRVSGRSL